MRCIVLLFALLALVSSVVIPRGQDALLHGLACQPCVNLIQNGENTAEGDFDNWFDKESAKVCAETGIMKSQCVALLKEKEEEINHVIDTKGDPLTACKKLDFCN